MKGKEEEEEKEEEGTYFVDLLKMWMEFADDMMRFEIYLWCGNTDKVPLACEFLAAALISIGNFSAARDIRVPQ